MGLPSYHPSCNFFSYILEFLPTNYCPGVYKNTCETPDKGCISGQGKIPRKNILTVDNPTWGGGIAKKY